jgi:arginine decarboxylase
MDALARPKVSATQTLKFATLSISHYPTRPRPPELPQLDQTRAPVLDTLVRYAAGDILPLHTPGHKRGRFAPPRLKELWGEAVWRLDLPSMTATDNLQHPQGCLIEAQALAAELFGADATYFLTGGSSQAVSAMFLTAAPPGSTVLMPRNVHRSVVNALALSGAVPKFLPHGVLADCGALGVDAATITHALDTEANVSAVFLTRPSYYGLARDLGEVVKLCRQRNVLLLVDEAHGAHLGICPAGGPESALAAGADLVAQSWHKTLGSLVGSAVLHRGSGSRVDPFRLQSALNLLHSTSASFLLLASLDAVRQRLAHDGREVFARTVAEVRELAAKINALPGLRVLSAEGDERLAGHRCDPLRMVVSVRETGWNGYDVERLIRNEFSIEDEMADWFNVVLVLGPGDDPIALERFLNAMKHVAAKPRAADAQQESASQWLQPPIPTLAMTPREAALATSEAVPLARCAGRVCAETVAFYPPGIPFLMPGERITADIIAASESLSRAGAYCHAMDESLATIRVVR